MERAAVSASQPPAAVFQDGLGERHYIEDPTGTGTLELLSLRAELAEVPSFEFALRERVSRLANFRHAYYGRVRNVERASDRDQTLTVASEATPGVRLSELFQKVEEHHLSLDINAALCLIRQLVPAVAILHETARDVAHGALGPERLIVTPNARLVIVEYVLGAALEQLRFSQERYWSDLRIALPRTAGLPRFDHRADVTQIGMIALSLILGRSLKLDEYPARIGDVVASTWAVSPRGGFEPLPPGLRSWLGRALQLDTRSSFPSAIEARTELDKVLGDSDYMASPASLDAFLGKYHAIERPRVPVALPHAAPAPVVSIAPPPAVPAAPAPPAPAPPSVYSAAPIIAKPSPPAPPAQPPSPVYSSPDLPRSVAPPPPVAPPLPVYVAPPPEIPRMAVPPPAPHVPAASAPPPAVVSNPAFDLQPLAGSVSVKQPQFSAPAASTHRPTMFEAATEDAFPEDAPPRSRRMMMIAAAAVALVTIGIGGTLASRRIFVPKAAVEATGTLIITTNPVGAEAVVDGQPQGTTPLTIALAPGAHTVELRGAGEPRKIPVTIAAGQQVAQYIDLPKVASAVGQLQVRSEPAGARVSVDGTPRGTSPALVTNLTPGEHIVVVESDLGSVKQTVTVESGMTAALVVPLGTPQGGLVSGWVSITGPMNVQIFEQGRLLGSSDTDRIMVSAGRHELEMVNDELGFRVSKTVQVPPGKVAAVALDRPTGSLSLNALPWAEVWIDGEKIGETPIGNVSLPIGAHDVVFRHPELGERHQTAVVTLKAPIRLSVDLRKK